MPACSRCLIEVFPGTPVCPKCGAAIMPTVIRRPAPKRVGKTRQRVNNLERREWILGPASLVLLASFWLPWFTVSIGPLSLSVNGPRAHGWLFIGVLGSIVLLLYVLITAFDVGDLAQQGRMSKEQLLTLLTGVDLVLVVFGFLLKPTGFSWGYGAYLALVAAIASFLPYGIPFIKERRGR